MNDEIFKEMTLVFDDDILMELSLSNLKNNVTRNFGNERNTRSNRIKVANYEAIPSVKDKTLLLKARIVGEESNYQVQVRFINVNFSQAAQAGFIEIVAMDGQTYHIKQFTLSQTQSKVKCTCLDFHYRFSVWNHSKRALEGDPPAPYVKTTDAPPVNPNKVPGACKHIMKFMAFLKGEQIAR